jgi:hypothetical protein
LDAAIDLGTEIDSAAAAATAVVASAEPAPAATTANHQARSNVAAWTCSSYTIRQMHMYPLFKAAIGWLTEAEAQNARMQSSEQCG